MSDRWTEHGFTMGAAEVTRIARPKGYAVIGIATKHELLEVWVSPKGRKIKVYRRPPVDHFVRHLVSARTGTGEDQS